MLWEKWLKFSASALMFMLVQCTNWGRCNVSFHRGSVYFKWISHWSLPHEILTPSLVKVIIMLYSGCIDFSGIALQYMWHSTDSFSILSQIFLAQTLVHEFLQQPYNFNSPPHSSSECPTSLYMDSLWFLHATFLYSLPKKN